MVLGEVTCFLTLSCNFLVAVMDLIKGLVHYAGQWDETNTYSDYEVAGILIPCNCSLQNLKSLISDEIGAAIDDI